MLSSAERHEGLRDNYDKATALPAALNSRRGGLVRLLSRRMTHMIHGRACQTILRIYKHYALFVGPGLRVYDPYF